MGIGESTILFSSSPHPSIRLGSVVCVLPTCISTVLSATQEFRQALCISFQACYFLCSYLFSPNFLGALPVLNLALWQLNQVKKCSLDFSFFNFYFPPVIFRTGLIASFWPAFGHFLLLVAQGSLTLMIFLSLPSKY